MASPTQQTTTAPRIIPLGSDPYLNFTDWSRSCIESAKKAYGETSPNGLYGLGYIETAAAWAARHPDTTDVAGTLIPGAARPELPTRPDRPADNCTALQWQRYTFQVQEFVQFNHACIAFDNEHHISIGQERIDEISHPTNGMAGISAADIMQHIRTTYGTMTHGKLIQLRDMCKYKGTRTLPAHVTFCKKIYCVLDDYGNPVSEMDKQDFFMTSLADIPRDKSFLNLYNDKHRTMASRSFAEMTKYVLELDAATPLERADAHSTTATSPLDDIDMHINSDIPWLRAAATAAAADRRNGRHDPGPRAGPSATQPSDSHRMRELELSVMRLELASLQQAHAATQASAAPPSAPPPSTQKHYCFLHGSNAPHQSNGCPVMKADPLYTSEMRSAHKKLKLQNTNGDWIWGAD